MTALQDRYRDVIHEVQSIAGECGTPPPTVVVVSKNRPAEQVREIYEAGARNFGENRTQGLQEREKTLGDLEDIHWHYIGHLQTNKVSKVVGVAEMIHSVDSVRLMECLDNRARRTKLDPVSVLLQVNVAHEDQKFGFDPTALTAALQFSERLEHIRIEGLMTMAPLDADTVTCEKVFGGLAECHRQLIDSSEGRYTGEQLSMGMSNDYKAAIRQGATLVRIGSAIFEGDGDGDG